MGIIRKEKATKSVHVGDRLGCLSFVNNNLLKKFCMNDTICMNRIMSKYEGVVG